MAVTWLTVLNLSDLSLTPLTQPIPGCDAQAMDSLLLPMGFIKVAVLGKDAVYATREQLGLFPQEFLGNGDSTVYFCGRFGHDFGQVWYVILTYLEQIP